MEFDLQSPEFWDEGSVRQEILRVGDVCHGCRRCFNLCPSFETLFGRIDARDGEVAALSRAEIDEVVDLCYQCKLCYNHCPYTPPHRFDIDFPRLMLRAKAVRAHRAGVTWQDRILGMTDLVGSLGSLFAPVTNWMNRIRASRLLLHRTLGIHERRILPRYHRQTFARWIARHGKRLPRGEAGARRVALFHTCFVNYNDPGVGRAAVRVLERNGLHISSPDQRCCGMPFLDGGDIGSALRNLRENVRSLGVAVDEGCDIVVPGPTCSYMIRREYPILDPSPETKRVAEHTYDMCEYLMKLKGEGALDMRFGWGPGRVAYHVPCHLRAQNLGLKSRDLLALLPGTEVEAIENCAGIDGTWGLKRQYFDLSLGVAQRLFRAVESSASATVATDCPLAALQLEQGMGRRAVHPVRLVARAYGLPED